MIYFGFFVNIINVEVAFLYGDSAEEMYMEFPPGMIKLAKCNCIIFGENMYILVLAARHATRSCMDFEECFIGIYMKNNKECDAYVSLYLNYNLCIGIPMAIKKAIELL